MLSKPRRASRPSQWRRSLRVRELARGPLRAKFQDKAHRPVSGLVGEGEELTPSFYLFHEDVTVGGHQCSEQTLLSSLCSGKTASDPGPTAVLRAQVRAVAPPPSPSAESQPHGWGVPVGI